VLGITEGFCQGEYAPAASRCVKKETITSPNAGLVGLAKSNEILLPLGYGPFGRANKLQPNFHSVVLVRIVAAELVSRSIGAGLFSTRAGCFISGSRSV
jgi:hypothetical protein